MRTAIPAQSAAAVSGRVGRRGAMMIDVPGSVESASGAAESALARDDTPLGVQARWALDLLTGVRPVSQETLAGHFVSAFLDKHPQGFPAVLDAWRDQGPFRLAETRLVAHKGWLTLEGPTGTRHALSVIIDSTGLIRILQMQPETVVPEVHSWADVDEALRIPGVDSSFLAARIERGRRTVLHELAAERPMPTGSAYKLYVMRALVHAVDHGELGWDDEVVIRPELRSLPTGDMQDLADGTRVTVRETARKMIAMSDNTAADLIADRLGRDAVERAVRASGHHDPSLLSPFLASREVFELGWGDPVLRKVWTEGDESARRRLLGQLARPLTVRSSDLGPTVHQLGLDWRMSAYDVCEVLTALAQDSARDATGTVESILTEYPGIAIDSEIWAGAIFKGGSCPGVMMFCWLLEDHEGVRHVLVLQQASDEQRLIGDGLLLRGIGARVIDSGLLGGAKRTAG
ncbi:serine hydrolase [Streptomyces sp. LN785]|uniref:serine hydrolase n=1 Tax=Streptomyces sp. LN785 TaxID=3112983 RepID=UPI00371D8E94